MKKLFLDILLIILVLSGLQLSYAARQNPLKNPKICGRPMCEPTTSKFGYTDSNRYKYDYSVHLRTEFAGTGQNSSDVYISAEVDLIFPKQCEGVMTLSSIQLREKIVEEVAKPTESSTFVDYYDYTNLDASPETEAEAEVDDGSLHPKSRDLGVDLKKYDLRFSFHDGVISEVCPHVGEPSWVLNFKKGILSAIQNSMLRFDVDLNTTETDVSGRCNVAYSLEGTADAFVIIKKTKDLYSCRFRRSMHSILQTTPYVFREEKAIWPILNSHSYCNLTIDHSIYREVSCFERHQLIPFSNNQSGAVTTARAKLVLNSEEPYNSGDFFAYEDEHLIHKRSPLLFDHTPATKPTHGEIKASRDLLKQMCNVGFPNIQREFIDIFTSFLQTTKHLDYKALTQLLARSAGICSNGKNHVLESLPYIGSTAAYQLMRDQIVFNTIPKNLAHDWMASLSFIQRPDDQTLETFYTILEFSKKKIDADYTLASTAVIHSFCKHNPNCGSNERIKKIIHLLETEFLSLFNMYKNERRSHDRLMVILKGLGNIGVLSEPFAEQLKEIITEGIAPVDIRLQSVLAFRRVDCIKYREFFLDAYGNVTINSEIRIFSYIQAMRCPDYQSIDFIKEVLRSEEVNQVGSYVWSHLKNLAKSSSPVRIEAQGLLVNDDLSDKFKLDIRKFSRNYEHSIFFDEYNFGTSTEANLIFGTDSYMPRMTTLNFTADLFGQSVNFFEISARAEGFEELASSIFGPKGPLNRELFRRKFGFLGKWLGEKTVLNEESLDNFLDFDPLRIKRSAEVGVTETAAVDDDDYEFEEDEDEDLPKNRKTRSANRKESIEKNVDDLGYKLKYNYNKPKATIGLRIFGNDLRFYSLEGLAEVMAVAKEFDPFHQAAKLLSGNEITYTKSSVFLDASYNIPMAIGLPLSIHAFGASSIDLRISGSLDRMRDAADYWHFDVDGKLKPSVSVDVITTMQADAFYTLSGIRVKSNLYSSSAVEAKMKIRGASLVSLTFSLPQDKNEIFSARSEMIVMKESQEIPQSGIDKRSSNITCTWPILDKAVGLKVCSSFSVPDLSNSSEIAYPGLILSGPVNISWVLEKSDPSAKQFVFKYEWTQVQNDSNWSFIFTTPDSAVKRLLMANVSTVPAAANASVWFINGVHTYSAGGVYSGNPDDRRLDVYIDTNGRKNFDLKVEMKRIQERNAWVYKPRALLSVNGENITGFVGTIRINEKSGISQNDVELTFETKKLQVLVKGNVVRSEITTSTNMTINYRFQANQIETVQFEGKLTNTGDKSKTEYNGNMKLKTSAHARLNFASNATWLSLQGHTEGVLTYNNDPEVIDPGQTSRLRLIFARSHSEDYAWESSRTKASVELTVPKSNIDFRILVKHEERSKNGTEHNVIVGLKYAPQKEATGVFSVHLPRRNLFAVDAYMNLTVPEFNSCTVRLKLNEKSKQDYMVNFNGTWFSGHSISVKGNYKDKSSRVQVVHHLKLLVESPSFEVTSFNLIFRRNQVLLFADVQAKYNKDPYGLTLQYNRNENNTDSNAEIKLKIKERDYWLAAKLLSQQPKMLQIEIHLDKLRDIHLKIGMLTIPKRKELSVELKWDANRDPSQRLAISAEYNNPANKTYDATLMFTYPDRTFSCGFNIFSGGPKYYGSGRATWGTNDVILLNYDAGFIPGKEFNNWVRAELSTPFDGWYKNSLSAGIYNHENLILVNSSILWADSQRLQLGYESNYKVKEPLLSFHVGLSINSTIKDIPTVTVKVKHSQDLMKFDSEVDLRYNDVNETLNIYSIKSVWELLKKEGYQNISGSVLMLSPFEGYRKGGLATRLSLSDDRRIQGAASLNFDIREFTLAMDGYVKKFTDNMLEINITTPLEKFRTINSRFGLSEKRRHAVAEIRSPAMAFGAEFLFLVNAFSDFDVKLSLATPIENFRQVAFIGKVKPNTVDVRGNLNNSTLGFTGVWRFHNVTDFEYSYLVYTPFVGFEKNGFIVKLIKRDVFVLEIHGKLSSHKLGIKVNGKPKSKLFNLISPNKLNLELLYDDDLQPPESSEEEEDYDDEEYDVNEYFTYFVDLELDTLTWSTITGQVDIQEISDFYIVIGEANLPAGRIDFKDRLYYPDMLNIKNVLNLWTPFNVCRNLKSIVEYHIDLDKFFIERVEFVIDNGITVPTEFGFIVNYTKVMEDKEIKQHDLALMVKTPFEIVKEIEIEAFLELEDNIQRGNISSRTATTMLSLAASVEAEENFLESSVGIILNTNVIPHYACKAYFKKDFSDVDNSINIQFEVNDNGTINKLQIESGWNISPANIVNAKGKVQTNMLPLKLAESSILLTKGSNPALNFDFALVSQDGQRIEYGSRASKKKDVFNIEIWTPLRSYRNISLHGTLSRNQARTNEYLVNGHLYRNMAVFIVTGSVQMTDTYPAQTRLRVQPKAGGPDGVIELTIKDSDGNRGKSFQFSAIEDGRMCQISGGYSMRNKLDWDFDVLVQSTEPDISRISINGKVQPKTDTNFIGEIGLQTPWRHLGIESVHLGTNINVQKDSGKVEGEYHIGNAIGRGSCEWAWVLAQNMQLIMESYMERENAPPRIVHASAKYLNPNKSFKRLLTGGKLNVDSKWILEVNGTLAYLSGNDVQGGLVLQIPQPVGDLHHLSARYRGNLMTKEPMNVFVEGKYESQEAKNRLLTRASYRNANDLQGLCRIQWGKATNISTVEGDFQVLRKKEVRKEFYAKLITPKFDEDTVFINGYYDQNEDFHLMKCTVDFPASRRLGDLDVSFNSMSNMNGHVNGTTPFFNITWLRGDFNFSTTGGESIRYMKATWPADTGFFNLHSTYNSQNLDRDLQGSIQVEVPLTTRHHANIDYKLKERQLMNTGHANVVYNDKNVLNGQYNCKTEQRMGFEKDIIDITLENELKPLGIHYVHEKQYTDAEFPDHDMKHCEVFELRNAKALNLTGELHVRSTKTGQEFKIVAIHPNRTIILNSEYDYRDLNTKHKSKLQLAPTAWIGYNFEIGNSSTATNESQNFIFELSYPRRNLSAEGWYYVTDDKFDSDISFKWTVSPKTKEKKTVRAGLLWQSELLQKGDKDNQTVIVSIGHPYLEKDVEFKGSYYRGLLDLLRASLIVDYSNDPQHLVTFKTLLRDLTSTKGFTNYTLDILVAHPASTLDVNVHGTAAAKTSYYKTQSYAHYRRGYFPEKKGMFLAKLDLNNKEFEYERTSPYREVRFWAIPHTKYPIYGINATVWDSSDLNNTGFVYVDLEKKFARAEFNLTEDSSQNLQMIGYIPDARSGFLDIWRNYEEIRIIDVSSFIKMNHSRLITGQFHWRPKMKEDLKAKMQVIGTSFYTSFSDGIDFWIKNVYSETVESVNDIWGTAKIHTQSFLDDVGELSVLEKDLEELRVFVNQSYEANDFYIKTVVNFTLSVLDELAIRDHIKSLPKIFTELWHAMGDSGKALRKNIMWLIETIKSSYNKALDAISKFFHGESLRYLSDLMEKGVEKYDKFIKDLHISFIKYVENLWNKFSIMMSNYWKSVLKRIEPHVFRFLSYIESAAWNISKEVFDFIYKRTNELAESPYFNKVSSFTQDVDRLYKDIRSNDAITNIKKYSVLAWNFIKEKYFKLVPFGQELDQVITEIWEEVKGLQNLEHIQVIIQKTKEIIAKIDWLAEELQFEYRLHQLYALLRNKFRNYALNALETADMYREAKTKFIFDPEVGIIDLEQKLPMSWHAFNETPKFEEIPEYKFLANAQNFFASTNASIVKYIYSFKSHLDPNTWLPPYTQRSLLIGSRHYMTFDKRFVGLNLQFEEQQAQGNNPQCSYLLAQDFFQRNFTLLLEPSTSATKKLTLLADNQILEIDLDADTLTIDGNTSPMLPLEFGSVTIYREMDILTVQSDKDFSLNCNIQFDLCWFEVSGWYYGQTAGILGTLNNERFDEYMTSRNIVVGDEEEFTDSWSLQGCKQKKISNKRKVSSEVIETCDHFFMSGMLSACADTIDPLPFLQMCHNLGANSNRMSDINPAVKGICTAALAYIEACAAAKIPMRVPDQCIFCKLLNGTFVPEGTFITLKNENIPKTADVVFIVEAKPCNANLTLGKNIMTVVGSLQEELAAVKITNNRFAVLTFGGHGPFDLPHSIVHHNQVFTTDINELQKYFDHIKVANGTNNDILQAISAATHLKFRPAASKVLILLSCSDCSSKEMKFDFTSILQYMLEEGVNLHILADTEFDFERTRKLRHFFGLDRDFVYSKRFLDGDAESRKQLHIPKDNLGLCTPLALETNGSVFTARKLQPERRYPIKRFAGIFAKRVAKTASPNTCQRCECTGHNTGVSYISCTPCSLPTHSSVEDYDFQFNDWDWDDEQIEEEI